MKLNPALIVIALFIAGCTEQTPPQSSSPPLPVETLALYNGTDLTGWYADVPDMDDDASLESPFFVRDENLVSAGEPRGHLITEEEYQDYRLVVEYRFPGEPGNAGVLIHASDHRALYDMFPKSLEVQMMHENAGDFWVIVEDIEVPEMEARRGPKEEWGITEGKARRILNLTDNSEMPLGAWNTMVVETVKDSVRVWVNGELVNDGFNATVQSGKIALQAEGSEVEFRTVELTPIEMLSPIYN